ncbi:MAG: DUF1592 domain-containing protein [Verrucomicrobia subdivision 3 bacterium]|nr:DUF1592 domain-containing protein [Limisphaerales bacterium]
MRLVFYIACFGVVISASAARVASGLVVFYDFGSAQGAVVRDRSGVKPAVDLQIAALQNVQRAKGSLEISKGTVIRSAQPPARLINALKRSGEITIEAWLQPANTTQDGPARIITLSRDTSERNFTLGQEKNLFDVRLRTSRSSNNGIPSTATPARSLAARLTHVVFTRDRAGRTTIFLDGKRRADQTIAGNFANWNNGYTLALGNELSNERPWRGTFHLVAIYDRSLSSTEVTQNFQAGPQGKVDRAAIAKAESIELFETKIAPLFAKHCLECHDPATRKGKLDLTQRATAFADSETIVPGKSTASLIWEVVSENEMPKKRPPLSTEEKAALKQWIDGGAQWSLARIDPAVYTHGESSHANWIRRLTVPEYIATVRAATGVDISTDARHLLPPDVRADGFSNTSYNLNVGLKHINAYAQLAAMITKRIDPKKFAARFSRSRDMTDKVMRPLVEAMGKWLLRGPLNDREIVVYRGITTTVVANGGGFDEAIGLVIEAMLQSPRFIYRIENQKTDGPLDGYEMASRLSYLIWGAPPDAALYASAEKGELANAAKLQAHVRRMLKDPRAVDRSVQFVSEWLNLDHLANLRPDKKRFPNWTPALAADMRTETIAFFTEVAWKQNRPLADLLNAQVSFLTPALARHYRMPNIAAGNNLTRYDLADIPARGGLLTQGSVLTVGGDGASMVTRGLFVMHDLLRGVVKDPPPCVDTTPVPTKPGLTQRAIAAQRIANKKCGGCHSKFEPLAFGLEKYDGLGAFFEKDPHGNRLREDGQILFPSAAKSIAYKTSAELMNQLAASDRVRHSLTWKLTQFALGRPLGARDAHTVDKIHLAAQKQGGTYPALITAIAMSDLMRTTQTEHSK